MIKLRLIRELSENQREWRNSPEIQRWTRGSELISHEDQVKWLKRISEDPTILMFGVEVEEKSKVPGMRKKPVIVGAAGLTSVSHIHKTAEFSLFIGPEYQRKGYGERALRELLNYGFKNLALRVIYGETFEGNPAWALFQKLGFQETGRHRKRYFKEGRSLDAICFDILSDEWLSSSP